MAEFHWRKKRLLSKDENKNKKTKKEKDNSFREIALTKMAKRQLLVTLLSIFGVTFVAFGSAFAVFTTTVRSEDYNTIAVGTLNITFGTESTIDLNGQYPVTDAVGLASTAYTFTIKNTGTLAADYTVHIQDDTDMISQDGCSGSQLDKNYIKYSLDGSTVNILGNMANNNNYQISSGTLAAGDSRTYTIRVWIADGAPNSILNKHYHGKIVVNAVNTQGDPVSEVITTNLGDNGSTYDDGTDTFITGEDPNNYIWYSGKLWRAVSVNKSDKTTKLVTQWNISAIPYNSSGNTAFDGSHMEMWLNDTSVDGFLGNLRDYEEFIVTDAKWNATQTTSSSKPAETTMVTDAVGLLNYYEYVTSYHGTTYSNGYLNNGLYWWTLTPYSASSVRHVYSNGRAFNISPTNARGARPSINLKSSVAISGGDGTENNPYRLQGDNDSNLSGTLLNTRYSGEYISFGTGENNLYRIVSHETTGLTKITSAESLKDSGTFKTLAFGSNATFSSTNTIGTFLNGEYLTSGSYLSSDQVNMIEDSTTWYLGAVGSGVNYLLAKYTDTSMTTTTTSTTAQVGLLRLGELMAGQQFDRSSNNTNYWLLTPYSASGVRSVDNSGSANYGSPTSAYGARPSVNLKSNVVITSGDGTKNSPFVIELGS